MITTALTPYKEYYRGIPGRVLDQYGIQHDGDKIVFNYRNSTGDVVAQKCRTADKAKLWWTGNSNTVAGLAHT